MSKGFLTSCLIVAAAGGLGYWYWADAPASPKRSARYYPVIAANKTDGIVDSNVGVPAVGESVEMIDLSRVFEPTGEELDLQNLIGTAEETEQLPLPREVVLFVLPDADAADHFETVSIADSWTAFKRDFTYSIRWRCAELINYLQPLIGSEMMGVEAE